MDLETWPLARRRSRKFIRTIHTNKGLTVNSFSPYATTHIVVLEVGPEATRFLVHESVLSRSEVLAKSYNLPFIKQSILLPELDQATAHTLVHYLYTGKYQTLSVHAASDKVIPESYKLSACAYCAAVRYGLPGLTELARSKIKSFGEDVTVFDMLAVARDYAFPLLPEDDVWYPEYLEDALHHAMAKDPTPFRKPNFITIVEGNSRLLQLVWEIMINNYAQIPATPTPVVKDDIDVTPAAELVPDIPESNGDMNSATTVEMQEFSNDKLEAAIDPQSIIEEPTNNTTLVPEGTQDTSAQTGDTKPNVQIPATPDPFTDELGFMSSKTYQQMGKKADQTMPSDRPLEEKPKVTGHVRSDSVTQIEQPMIASDLESKEGDGAGIVGGVEQVPNGASDVVIPKKSKKSKKSKRGADTKQVGYNGRKGDD
jgi:hypothetical protein